jgi:hypothetical protein
MLLEGIPTKFQKLDLHAINGRKIRRTNKPYNPVNLSHHIPFYLKFILLIFSTSKQNLFFFKKKKKKKNYFFFFDQYMKGGKGYKE